MTFSACALLFLSLSGSSIWVHKFGSIDGQAKIAGLWPSSFVRFRGSWFKGFSI